MNTIDYTDDRFFYPMKTILIVEDKHDVIMSILTTLGSMFKVVVITNTGALYHFVDNYVPGVIDAAIFDARLGSKDHNSLLGLRRLRDTGFVGPILANSGTDNSELLQAGADEQSLDKKKAGEQIIRMLVERVAEWIPVAMRNLINLYDIQKWDQLVSLIASLSPDQITRLREEMNNIRRSEEAPDKYKDGAIEIHIAIQQAEDPMTTKHLPLEPEYAKVLDELKQYLQ